jgi:AcrR family transcriptional regulator
MKKDIEQTDPTSETILTNGLEEVMTTGVRAFTVESLANRLGMSKKTIYKFFPSKEVLIRNIMEFMTGRIKRQFDAILLTEPNAALQFIGVLMVISKQISNVSPERIAEVKVRYPQIWRDVEAFRFERMENMRGIFQLGQEQGLVRDDLNVDHVAKLFSTIINHIFQPEFFVQNQVTIRETFDLMIQIFSRGLFTEEGRTIIEDAL